MQTKSLKDRAMQWLETKNPSLEQIKSAHRAMEVRIRKHEQTSVPAGLHKIIQTQALITAAANAEPNTPITLIEGAKVSSDAAVSHAEKACGIDTADNFDPADAEEAVQKLAEAYCERGGEFDDLLQTGGQANLAPGSACENNLSLNQLGDPPTIQPVTLTPDQKRSVIADLKAQLKATPKGEGRNGRARRRETMAPISETLH